MGSRGIGPRVRKRSAILGSSVGGFFFFCCLAGVVGGVAASMFANTMGVSPCGLSIGEGCTFEIQQGLGE